MPKIKVVVLSVWKLQHGFTKKAKVSPNLTVAQILGLSTERGDRILHRGLYLLLCGT